MPATVGWTLSMRVPGCLPHSIKRSFGSGRVRLAGAWLFTGKLSVSMPGHRLVVLELKSADVSYCPGCPVPSVVLQLKVRSWDKRANGQFL